MQKVKMSLGKTFNIGNYESIRVDVGIEREVKDITQNTKDELYDEVLQLMKDTAKKIKVE